MNQPALFTLPLTPIADVSMSRHKGNAESIAANPSQESKRASHSRILAILATGNYTSKEICEQMGYGDKISLISGRISELKASGEVVKTGDRRDGCAVLRKI